MFVAKGPGLRAGLVALGAALGSFLTSTDGSSSLADLQSPQRAGPAGATAEADPLMERIRLLDGDTHKGEFVRPESGSAYLQISPNTLRGSPYRVPVSDLSQEALAHLWTNDVDTGVFRVIRVNEDFVVADVRQFDILAGLNLVLISGEERTVQNPIGSSSPLHPRDQRRLLRRGASEGNKEPVLQEKPVLQAVAEDRRVIEFDALPAREWQSADTSNRHTFRARLAAVGIEDGKVVRLVIEGEQGPLRLAIGDVSPKCQEYVDRQISGGSSPSPIEQSSGFESRVWQAAGGRHSVQATLVRIQDGSVVLERTGDGRSITVALDLLSKADREYIARIQESQRLGSSPAERKKTQAERELGNILQSILDVTGDRQGVRDFYKILRHQGMLVCVVFTKDGSLHSIVFNMREEGLESFHTALETVSLPEQNAPERVAFSMGDGTLAVSAGNVVGFYTAHPEDGDLAVLDPNIMEFPHSVTGIAYNTLDPTSSAEPALLYVNLGVEIRVFGADRDLAGKIGERVLRDAKLLAINGEGDIATIDSGQVFVFGPDGDLKSRASYHHGTDIDAIIWWGDELFVISGGFGEVTPIK